MGEAWFLCGWTEDGTHMNYGVIDALPDPSDPAYEDMLKNEIRRVTDLATN